MSTFANSVAPNTMMSPLPLAHRLPQTVAHRGYSAKFPENTMAAFAGAVHAGAHALETDVRLSKDAVVVLSHASFLTPPCVCVLAPNPAFPPGSDAETVFRGKGAGC